MELIPYQDIEKMGKAVSNSGLFGIKTEAQAVALMLIAQALGKHPALAAMEYNIIQGRPAKKADAMQVDFQAAGGKIEWHELNDTKADATFTHPSSVAPLRLTWDIDRAKKAGLYDKDGSMYKKYPRQMLRARLVADGVRAVYPAATGGMLSKEEAEDIGGEAVDSNKSRVEQVVEEATFSPAKEVKEDVKKEEPKSKEDKVKKNKQLPESENKGAVKGDVSTTDSPVLPKDHKIIIGVIDTETVDGEGKLLGYKTLTTNHPETNKPGLKHSFLIEGKRYGTFDNDMAQKIIECMDKRIMVKIEFKERKTEKAVMNDIVGFKQAVAGTDYPIE